jgi:hypothetical protein
MTIKYVQRVSTPKNLINHHRLIYDSACLSRNIYHYHTRPIFCSKVKGKVLHVYFKGCSTWGDYAKSIDIRTCKIAGEMMIIHNGFFELFKRYENELDVKINRDLEHHEVSHIVFAGHSAGGVLSQIACLYVLGKIANNNIKGHCYTYGTPKSGDKHFMDAVQYVTEGRFVRVETFNDIVPLIPVHPLFVHGGSPLILKETTKKGFDFFTKYHTETFDFVNDMRKNDLLNKNDISRMIEGHKCETYVKSLHEYVWTPKTTWWSL